MSGGDSSGSGGGAGAPKETPRHSRLFRMLNPELFVQVTPSTKRLAIVGTAFFFGSLAYLTWSTRNYKPPGAPQPAGAGAEAGGAQGAPGGAAAAPVPRSQRPPKFKE
jgi:hypothetical protein